MISPAQVPSVGRARARRSSRSGSARPSRSMPSVIVVDSPPGMTSPSSPSRSAGHAHLARRGAEPGEHASRAPRSRPGGRARRRPPRSPAAVLEQARRSPSVPISMPGHRLPRARARRRPRARGRRSAWSPRRSRAARALRVLGLEDARADEVRPRRRAASSARRPPGWRCPPAQKSSRPAGCPSRRPSRTSSSGAWSSLAAVGSSISSSELSRRISPVISAHVAHRLDHVAGAGLALGADHRRALGDPPQRLAEVGRAAHERRP